MTSKLLRKLFLPLFARFNFGDITIEHHYTHEKFILHQFKHKGYWFHGKSRERKTMQLFELLLSKGNIVIEVGGHIGYISTFFSYLVGQEGQVYVFEPGPNNLPYLKKNISGRKNIELVEKGVGKEFTQLPFYVESLTGQNNSFVKDFERLERNQAAAFVDANIQTIFVDVIKLDDYVRDAEINVDFIKVDVEGFELQVVQGMENILNNIRPMCMIEIQANHQEIFDTMSSSGYLAFNDQLEVLTRPDQFFDNTFFLHTDTHSHILNELNLTSQ